MNIFDLAYISLFFVVFVILPAIYDVRVMSKKREEEYE